MFTPLPAKVLSLFVRKLRGTLQRLPAKRDYVGNWSICGAVRSLRRIERSIRNNVVWLMIFYFVYASKQADYCGKIKDSLHNLKFLFSTINKLLQMNSDRLYPSSTDDSALANTFADFFAVKISKIRTSIQGAKSNLGVTSLSPVTCTARLSSFCQVDCSVAHKLLTGLTKKFCSLDPLPAHVLKECGDTLLPIFTMIVNC